MEVVHNGHIGGARIGTVITVQNGGVAWAFSGVTGGGVNGLFEHGFQKGVLTKLPGGATGVTIGFGPMV